MLFEGWREEREKWESAIFGLPFSCADGTKIARKNFYVSERLQKYFWDLHYIY